MTDRTERGDILAGRCKEIPGHYPSPPMPPDEAQRYETARATARLCHDAKYVHNKAVKEAAASPTVAVRETLPGLLAESKDMNERITAGCVALGFDAPEAPIAIEEVSTDE